MNSCLIKDKNEVYVSLQKICMDSIKMGISQGFINIHNQIKELIDRAKKSPDPKNQLDLLRSAFEDFYKASNPFSNFLNAKFPLTSVLPLFNDNYKDVLVQPTPPTREQAVTNRQLRQRRFLDTKFKDATNAKLYFKRSIARDLVETFLVERSSDTPTYFSTQEEMNANVLKYKQKLLDRIFEYFDKNPLLRNKVSGVNRVMYTKQGDKDVYTGVIEEVKDIFDSEFAPELFQQGRGRRLDDIYKTYRDDTSEKQKESERFLDAYNAWIALQNFDTVVVDSFGSIVTVHEQDINGHLVHDLSKYEIKSKASRMWSTWLDSDDITDMADVISDIAQQLVETSRMYKWNESIPYKDRYVSFDDYNCVLGFIKRQAFKPTSNNITLNNLDGLEEVSPHTKRIMLELLSENRNNGQVELNAEGLYTPKAVTWKQLVSCIGEKPHKYLPAIFDILCSTDILDRIQENEGGQINSYIKNLIWSFNKEIFSSNSSDTRSLFRLHNLSAVDSVYPILTQVAASTFPEDYLQYYENQHGIFSTRLLQDYAIDNVRRELIQEIQQTAITLSSEDYAKYGIIYKSRTNNPEYLNDVIINFSEEDITLSVKATANNVSLTGSKTFTRNDYKKIWDSEKFQQLIKHVLGIDFDNDPDLKQAFVEENGGVSKSVKTMSNLLGRVLYSSIVNNEYAIHFTQNPRTLETFIEGQFGKDKKTTYSKKVDRTTGYIPMIPTDWETILLKELSQAKAINGNLLAAAQSVTGEGTSLANYSLSRLRNCYHNQLEKQCKKPNSATKNTTFVINANNLFEGIVSRRELKTLASNQQSTAFSDSQSMQLAFISDYLGSLLPDTNENAYLKRGRVSFLPTVNSDKQQIDGLLVNLYTQSHIPNGSGGYKLYVELSDSEIEQEMVSEFKDMYTTIISNINNELDKVVSLISLSPQTRKALNSETSILVKGELLRKIINDTFGRDESLGSDIKSRVINGLHQLVTAYNKEHSRNPIMLSEHIHYTFGENGIESNKVLDALYGRFNPNLSYEDKQYIRNLYSKEKDYLDYLERNDLDDSANNSSFFKYQEHLTVKDLLKMNFRIYLRGSDEVIRPDQPEIKFLRGESVFTDQQKSDPRYQAMAALNEEMKHWVNEEGLMILAKGIVDGKLEEITTIDQLNKAKDLQIHPMLSKLNRLDYLCTQQYTVATVGSHYVHKGYSNPGLVIAEEAQRWLASNKRNVAATSTVHVFQNKQLNGVPSVYNIAIIEDIKSDLYNVMGELYLEGHKPLDGGMFDNIWISYLENNSLCGEAVGGDKKPFGTFYDEKYAAGGIVKTAGFPPTNVRMRRSQSWINIQRNMAQRPWKKEHPDADGKDVLEVIDITRNYLINDPDVKAEDTIIDYTKAIKGQPIFYKKVAHDNPSELAAYRLDHIESLGNNQYRIYEVEVNSEGVEIGEVFARQENGSDIITINNNWDLFTKVFGGYYSLEIGSDNKLTWSENSNLLMVYAINNVGYRKSNEHLKAELDYVKGATSEMIDSLTNTTTGLDQDDIWQPLKYSDIHCVPNIGAIKSSQFNVNPDGKAVLDKQVDLNFFRMRMAQFGIQLDKEHHVDMSEVSMPTQIIQALANRSYTSEYAKEAYDALAILTKQAINPYLKGINEIITSNGKDIGTLSEEVTTLILDHLLKQSGEETSINAIMADLLDKAKAGKKLKFSEDIQGKIPWSDPTVYNKLFSVISTTLTNVAVKMKFPGSLSVICPTDGVEKLHGEYTLSSFVPAVTADGNTRTPIVELRLSNYQNSVREGLEVDSEGSNLLVYDVNRDLIQNDEDAVINAESVKNIDEIHTILIQTLRNESSFNKLLTINESEVPDLVTNALQRYNLPVTESAIQYAKRFIKNIQNANLTYSDVYGTIAYSQAKERGMSDTVFNELQVIRQLFSNEEETTDVLPYRLFKQYENLIESTTDITQDREYDSNVKGYRVTPSELIAIKRIIDIFGNVSDNKTLNTVYHIVNSDIPLLPKANDTNLIALLSGALKPQTDVQARRNIARKKLSKISELKTQHNYIIELSDGTKENITINTPLDYYKVKNLVLFGAKNPSNVSNLISPFNYDETYYSILQRLESDIDINDTKEGLIASYLSIPILLQASVKKETGMGNGDIRKLFGLFKSKANGGVSIERLAEQIYRENPDKFEDDYEIRDLIIDAILSSNTTGDLKSYGRRALEKMAEVETEALYSQYAQVIHNDYKMGVDDYEKYYFEQTTPITVTKIYENVVDGRSLGAYNVRFWDNATNTRFQIYDLDSVNLLFKLNGLITDPKKEVRGYEVFTKLGSAQQQRVLTPIFNSPLFDRVAVYNALQPKYPNLPPLDINFVETVNNLYPGELSTIIDSIRKILKPNIYRIMQKDLFKLSENFKGDDRTVFVNGRVIIPSDIKTEAYELIMPQVYKTVFGLQENDDLQEILRDKDFFIKRGLKRFKSKVKDDIYYDYELKNFTGEHFYIFDTTKGIPEHLQKHIDPIITDTRKGKIYRITSDDEVLYEMSSEKDRVCKIGDAQIILTDNPMFYLDTLNYNTIKASPVNTTKESYATLIEHLRKSKRKNHVNYLKALTTPSGEYLSLNEFKKLNTKIEDLNFDSVSYTTEVSDFKSLAQICRLILQNGRELHTAFKESLNVVAGRIPAQSQQSFMTQKVVAFDSSGVNTAMVSTFQLFLQGSDLDIDAVTLLGYEFDKHGKFIAWSPYFNTTSEEFLQASKEIPLPTGEKIEVNVSSSVENNFYQIYDKYFGTLFKYIPLPNGGIKTINEVPVLQLDTNTPENMVLLANFLRDVKKYGINLQGELQDGKVNLVEPEENIKFQYNLTQQIEKGGLGIRSNQLYDIAKQVLKFVNDHNDYLNTAEEHLRMKMAKNYVVNYIYKTAAAPCNQTEAQVSVDTATAVLHEGAAYYAKDSGENSHAPGRVTSKIDMIGKGQAGKSGVGIGAVGIKANSTTQFYLSQIWNEGSNWDKQMILFKRHHVIDGKIYKGFANMYTSKKFSKEERTRFSEAMSLLNELESNEQVTLDVANNIAAMLSIAVDNAKDLALAKINSGPRLMGMYVYGMTLGIPSRTLIDIMKSEEGMILAEMTEGSLFNRDTNAFKVLDVFSKLEGNIASDLAKYEYSFKDSRGFIVKYVSPKISIKGKNLEIKNTHDALFAAMYENYTRWFANNYKRLPKINRREQSLATNLPQMLKQLITLNAFDFVYNKQAEQTMENYINKFLVGNDSMKLNWIAAKNQMVSFIRDISKKAAKMRSSRGRDLKVLAEGAEEMRILGSILGINKGLKPTISEAESFIDTIENLIVDRKKILGINSSSVDRIDFTRFMVDEEYQQESIEAYEKVKHSVNILHLISKAPHFNGYLKTELIPTTFYANASVKYRTMRRYRLNAESDPSRKPRSIFDTFNATSKKDKEAILKGLENAVQHQLLKGWLRTPIPGTNTLRSFRVPKGFKYFTDRNTLVTASEDTVISLTTEAGLASFKKYMEEVYIPILQSSPDFTQNTFIRNLHKISYDKTATHNTVTTYSLTGDLMSSKGRQAELNSRMAADLQNLSTIGFQEGLGIASAVDAFYLYSQYCYGGKKGQKSLMSMFDAANAQCSLMKSFNSYVAQMDVSGEVNLTHEDIITWCAPIGTQYSSLNWIHTTGDNEFGVSLKQKIKNVQLDEDTAAALQEAKENIGEDEKPAKVEKYGIYRTDYLASQYDRTTRNYFLVPVDIKISREVIPMTISLFGESGDIHIKTVEQKISSLQFSQSVHDIIQKQIDSGVITKFKSVSEFRQDLLSKIALLDIPYKVSLTSQMKKEIDLGILQTIIDQHLNC